MHVQYLSKFWCYAYNPINYQSFQCYSQFHKPRVGHYNRLKLYHGDYDNWLDKNAVINDTYVQTSDNEQITVSDNKLAESEIFLTMKKPHLQSKIAGMAWVAH
jgi:hypothetical protein